MEEILSVFNAVKNQGRADELSQHGLTLKVGEGLGAALLKVMKPNWSTDDADLLVNSNGLFFSVWVDEACKAEGIVRYNLHAKKLRMIKGENFAARDFVRRFRMQSKAQLSSWPNCHFPKGPITLFEGYFPLSLKTLHSDTENLIARFIALVPVLESLLAE